MSDNQFFTILTETGKRKFRDAIAVGGCIDLREIAVGDGSGRPIEPSTQMTALVNEVYRAPISDNTMDPDNPAYAILNLVIPIEEGGWHVREAGVYDADGDLIFVGSLPSTYKPLPSMGVASDLSINLIIYVENAETITITVDPSKVLASQAWTEKVIHDAITSAWEHYRPEAGRLPLAESATIYVRMDGNDGNDGLSAASAKATIDGALNLAATYDAGRHNIQLDLGPGRFAVPEWLCGALMTSRASRDSFVIRGAGKDETVLTNDCVLYGTPTVWIQNLTMEGCLSVADNASAWIYSTRFRGNGGTALSAYRGGHVSFRDGTSQFEGSFSQVIHAETNASIEFQKSPALSGNVTCDTFAVALHGGVIWFQRSFNTDSYTVTGRKWRVENGRLLTDFGDPAAVIPGDVPGTTQVTGVGASGTGGRIRATGDVVIHVREDGDDANDGLSEATAKRTVDGALEVLYQYDFGKYRATIQFGPGRFSLSTIRTVGNQIQTVGSTYWLHYRGAGKNETCLVGIYLVYGHPGVSFSDLTVEGTLQFVDGTTCWLTNIRVRGNGGRGIYAYRNNTIKAENCELEGNFTDVLHMSEGSIISVMDAFTISDPLTCEFFAMAREGGTIYLTHAAVNSEQVTGVKWYTQDGGTLICRNDPDLVFPGNQPGFAHASSNRRSIASVTPVDCLTRSLTETGYAKMPGGLILQWGAADLGGGTSAAVTFPLAFPNACLSVSCVDYLSDIQWAYKTTAISYTAMTRQGVTLASADSNANGVSWQAIGY